ncbi:POTRA domain-containing protein [Hymenobacter weizhouensis]|uniref:POTRA domain-containing protein n=1 Tax=Hymenobacter sp. YIM 151500-1 TaxID=2987689 RepID=UPI002227BEAB|nr:POTRA domain-containing protein [Hymenobacter sp. YIM 151500-1]UYZ61849.1 hypothetical protein OIS53_12650 [Hymenobacter sp. YIM 151500-1]
MLARILACLLLVLVSHRVSAEARTMPVSAPDTAVAARPDSLLLLSQCPDYRQLRVGAIVLVGNAVTKESVLRAELDLHEGDTLAAAAVARRLEVNRRRLFNLQLFHQVLLQATCRAGELTILFSVQERWYTFPIPIFTLADRNYRSWLDRPDRWRRVDYGVHVVRRNFRGRNEQLIANVQLGFNRKYELFYEAPGYGRRRRIGFGAGASYYRSRALDYATRNDRLVNFRQADGDKGYPILRRYVTAGLRWRRTVQHLTALNVTYTHEQVSDSVFRRNPAYYLSGPQRRHVEFSLTSTLNQRNTFAYPLTGQFAQASVAYRTFLHEAPGILTLRGRYVRYVALGGPFYYSAGLRGQVRLARRLGYADSRAFGYDALVRGYDALVVEGHHYALLQQGLTYKLLDAGQLRLRAIRNPKFNQIPLVLYLNTFVDAGYVRNRAALPANRLPNRLLSSAGMALHLATYYDWVLTVEYTRTWHGYGGFFFRTEFPI